MLILERYVTREDDRGVFWGISREPWIREINYVEAAAGRVWGNHYHAETREMFFIIDGQVRVVIYDVQSREEDERIFEKGHIFIVEPYEVHTFYTLTDAEWINMLSKPIQQDNPDFHRHETLSIPPKGTGPLKGTGEPEEKT